MGWGLLVATACFTLWHYCAPFVGRTTVPLDTPVGALSTFGAGLVYAYAFQRTRNIIAPWLAHVVTGIAFIVVGAMDFTQPMW
jgi:membrane protease YdiL (CAAX protease family)